MREPFLEQLKRIDPAWWGAAAAVAGAGAVVVPSHRVLAAVAGGGLVLYLAWSRLPCCQKCADASTGQAKPADAAPKASIAVGESSPLAPPQPNVYTPAEEPVIPVYEVQQAPIERFATVRMAADGTNPYLSTPKADTSSNERQGAVDYLSMSRG